MARLEQQAALKEKELEVLKEQMSVHLVELAKQGDSGKMVELLVIENTELRNSKEKLIMDRVKKQSDWDISSHKLTELVGKINRPQFLLYSYAILILFLKHIFCIEPYVPREPQSYVSHRSAQKEVLTRCQGHINWYKLPFSSLIALGLFSLGLCFPKWI